MGGNRQINGKEEKEQTEGKGRKGQIGSSSCTSKKSF
jgi:hypothetical protein